MAIRDEFIAQHRREQAKRRPRRRPATAGQRPAWDSTIHDLNEYKLSPEQLEAKLARRRSKHQVALSTDLRAAWEAEQEAIVQSGGTASERKAAAVKADLSRAVMRELGALKAEQRGRSDVPRLEGVASRSESPEAPEIQGGTGRRPTAAQLLAERRRRQAEAERRARPRVVDFNQEIEDFEAARKAAKAASRAASTAPSSPHRALARGPPSPRRQESTQKAARIPAASSGQSAGAPAAAAGPSSPAAPDTSAAPRREEPAAPETEARLRREFEDFRGHASTMLSRIQQQIQQLLDPANAPKPSGDTPDTSMVRERTAAAPEPARRAPEGAPELPARRAQPAYVPPVDPTRLRAVHPGLEAKMPGGGVLRDPTPLEDIEATLPTYQAVRAVAMQRQGALADEARMHLEACPMPRGAAPPAPTTQPGGTQAAEAAAAELADAAGAPVLAGEDGRAQMHDPARVGTAELPVNRFLRREDGRVAVAFPPHDPSSLRSEVDKLLESYHAARRNLPQPVTQRSSAPPPLRSGVVDVASLLVQRGQAARGPVMPRDSMALAVHAAEGAVA
ncbi:unnamed protein product [Pedinophyceae sp. YPF-701]|nr:unnamed protein product [Pedinophyceae sp. YPF-701]